MACLLNPPRTNATPLPMVQTAKDSLVITPSFAFSGSEPVFDHRPNKAWKEFLGVFKTQSLSCEQPCLPPRDSENTLILLASVQSFPTNHKLNGNYSKFCNRSDAGVDDSLALVE
jgi:hypothetical protein